MVHPQTKPLDTLPIGSVRPAHRFGEVWGKGDQQETPPRIDVWTGMDIPVADSPLSRLGKALSEVGVLCRLMTPFEPCSSQTPQRGCVCHAIVTGLVGAVMGSGLLCRVDHRDWVVGRKATDSNCHKARSLQISGDWW